ncbi:hypothetical protein [Methylocystis echinoides]|uniref:hypothetical protein n=1 Tax=Methylocystis echinoides TaxID=29468 RepID=UPI003431343A
MVKLPELNRHMVGVSAIALALLGLGYLANMAGDNRRVASLLDRGASMPVNETSPSETNFLSMLKNIPPNAFGSAASGGNSDKSVSSSGDWTPDEWRVAADAVARARSGAKGQPANKQAAHASASGIVWRPPEEIASRNDAR